MSEFKSWVELVAGAAVVIAGAAVALVDAGHRALRLYERARKVLKHQG